MLRAAVQSNTGESSTFNTKNNPFQRDYAEKAHLQQSFNDRIIHDLVDYLAERFPNTAANPLCIADLGCGDGSATFKFLRALDNKGLRCNSIVGYDISPAQISKAAEYTKQDTRLTFLIQDMQAIDAFEQYDAIISLFALHWMDDIKQTAQKINAALKPNGALMFFVPLEKPDLFQIRQEIASNEVWALTLQDVKIRPFIEDESEYIEAFEQYFQQPNFKSGVEEKHFSEAKFIDFLSSWMPEMRAITEPGIKAQYIKDLVARIPDREPAAGAQALQNLTKMIQFREHFFYWQGSKSAGLSPAFSEPAKVLMFSRNTAVPRAVQQPDSAMQQPVSAEQCLLEQGASEPGIFPQLTALAEISAEKDLAAKDTVLQELRLAFDGILAQVLESDVPLEKQLVALQSLHTALHETNALLNEYLSKYQDRRQGSPRRI